MFVINAICAAAVVASVAALPAPDKVEVAARGYPSGGTTCYFSCPAITGYTLDNSSPTQNAQKTRAECDYTKKPGVMGKSSLTCYYNTANGKQPTGPPPSDMQCPTQAPQTYCGNWPTNQNFKRELAAPALSKQHKAVRDRQWTPEKAKARANELKARLAKNPHVKESLEELD